MQHLYLIALGGNRPHHRHGAPRAVLRTAARSLEQLGAVKAVAPIIATPPLGPSRRTYANGAVLLETESEPRALLASLKRIERSFGQRRGGAWQARTLDLDIVLWSGGPWCDDALIIPHPRFRERDFVLRPAAAVAPGWRDPMTGLSLRQLLARLSRPRPLPRSSPCLTAR